MQREADDACFAFAYNLNRTQRMVRCGALVSLVGLLPLCFLFNKSNGVLVNLLLASIHCVCVSVHCSVPGKACFCRETLPLRRSKRISYARVHHIHMLFSFLLFGTLKTNDYLHMLILFFPFPSHASILIISLLILMLNALLFFNFHLKLSP